MIENLEASVFSEWQETTLGEIVELKRGYDLPQQKRRPGKVPLVSSSGFTDYHDTSMVEGPGVVTGRYGTVGQVFYITDDFWPLNTTLYVRDFKGNDPRFISYFLRALNFLAYSDKAAVPGINRNHLHQAKVKCPPLDVQRQIAHVLGTLDDKIELNRRMNETLEAMTHTLFQSWFVDPTENGLPNGWRRCSIRDLASNIQYGLTQSASSEPVGPRFLRITDIQGGNVDWGSVPFCKVSQDESERYRLKSGDVLVARTGASTGENIYLPAVPDAVFASYLVRFQFSDAAIARLVGAFMRTSEYFDYVAGCIGGSAQPNASAQLLAGAELVLPNLELMRRYAEIVAPMDNRICANDEESRTLAALRDALLAKLLSGEVRLTPRKG